MIATRGEGNYTQRILLPKKNDETKNVVIYWYKGFLNITTAITTAHGYAYVVKVINQLRVNVPYK